MTTQSERLVCIETLLATQHAVKGHFLRVRLAAPKT